MNQPFKQPSKIALVISIAVGLTACQQVEEEIIISTTEVSQSTNTSSTLIDSHASALLNGLNDFSIGENSQQNL
ncbi:hypothetical protein J8L86_17615 [Shewanella sp. MMG014]|uniref:hypothetical protein n=1 Tax=Shewanella sp. MMG014 TaxID=2822691 RepID=UPI001B360D5A|nr:hypothetical protein [Shewanella sp. MMG014]MBQ4891669.1 hypothetical protein [Shewanella sp. MMG014]